MEPAGPGRVERRLAAILAADVAGYSRLIGADEEGTLSRLKALRAEVIDPKIAEHHGRIVKTTGDGLLVEFASVVDALRGAAEIQAAVAESNAPLPADKRIDLRIGINVGDIVVEDGDIFGGGVNVAARLEGLAEPGGICVSARVREDASGKIDLAFRDIGERQLKNIARPVRAYAVAATVSPIRARRRRIGTSRLAAAVIVLAVAGIGAMAWWIWPPLSSPATTAQALPNTNPPPASEAKPWPRLSIVVLPFANLSNDPEQQYFADGITDDLTTDLSRLRNVLVISRNTAFTYKGQRVDAKQIGRELGVRYVLEGSVRRSGNEVRINAQLIDAATNTHLWAERFDHDVGNLFVLQNEITSRIANTLGWELIGAETARSTDRPDALDYLLRGRAAQRGWGTRENEEEAVNLYEHALALDPHSVEAQIRLASALVNRAKPKDPAAAAADLQRAEQLMAQALAASPGDPFAHRVKGEFLRFERRCGDAVPEFEISLAADPNNPYALVGLSMCEFLTGGSDQEAIALTEKAIRLSPRDPGMWWWYTWIGFVHLLQSRIDEAIVWLEKGRSARPGANPPHYFLAAAYGLKGELELARAELTEALRLTGSDRYSSVARSRANGDLYTPALRDRWETVYFPGIRAAGLPEE
jgi:TolB-like protein/class 3 adenylate cyclase/tetratricopeptide (TPR) repeat protein